MGGPEQLMLFAVHTGRWVFYGSYGDREVLNRMISKLTNQHGYTRYHIVNLGPARGQGISWSSNVFVESGTTSARRD